MKKLTALLIIVSLTGCARVTEWIKEREEDKELLEEITGEKEKEPELKDDIDPANVITHFVRRDVLTSFKIVSEVKEVWLDNFLRWSWEPDPKWKNVGGCNGNIWMYWKAGDQWHGGPCDKIRPGQLYKNRGDFMRTEPPYKKPQNGEVVGIMFSTHCRHNVRQNGEERTAIKVFTWPPKRGE